MAAVISSIEPLIAVRKHLNYLTAISVDDLRIVWNLIKSRIDSRELFGSADPSPSCKSHDGPPWRTGQASKHGLKVDEES